MDSQPFPETSVSVTLRNLFRLSDEVIQEHQEEFKLLIQRISEQISIEPPVVTKERSLSAKEILDTTGKDLGLVRTFLERDRTSLILKGNPLDDSSAAQITGIEKQFQRVPCMRYLAPCYHDFLSPNERNVDGILGKRRRRYGRTKTFFEKNKLPVSSSNKTLLKCGEKAWYIEIELGIPGLWLALLPVLAKFPHVPWQEIVNIIRLLQYDFYPEVISLAREVSPQAEYYQQIYNFRVGLQPLPAHSQSDSSMSLITQDVDRDSDSQPD
jgi:hypothetical protein